MDPLQSPAQIKYKLLQILGVTFGVAVTVGGMIGLGILRTPGTVASQLGSVWLIMAVWIIGGIYALLGTLAVSELSTSIPKAGGWYVYARRAFGDYGGFVVGWSDWLSGCAVLAFTAITMGDYLPSLVPALSGRDKMVGCASLIGIGVLNLIGLRVGSRFQELTSFVKAVAFLGLVAACFIYGGGGGGDTMAAAQMTPVLMPVGTLALFLAVMLALQSVIYTYDGWYFAIYFSEENEDPATSIPRALIISVVSVMAIYLLVNLGLLYVLSLPQLAASTLPASDAAQTIFGSSGAVVISVLALITLPTIINSTLMVTPRTMFAMGRDGLFWSRAATVNRGGTPSASLILTVVVGLALVITGTFELLLSVTAFLFVIVYGSGFLAVFVLRKTEPDLHRPFRAWGYPWTTLIVLVGSIVFLIGQMISDTSNSIYSIAMIAASYPIFLIFRKIKQRADPVE